MKTKLTPDLLREGKKSILDTTKCIGALTLKKALDANSIPYIYVTWGATDGYADSRNYKSNYDFMNNLISVIYQWELLRSYIKPRTIKFTKL